MELDEKANVLTMRLRIDRCFNGNSRKMREDFHAAALLANRGMNAAQRFIQRWWEDHPDWQPETKERKRKQCKCKGKCECPRRVELVPKNAPAPMRIDYRGTPLSPEGALYREVVREVPALASNGACVAAGRLYGMLTTKMPWNHEGNALYKWQAIKEHEIAASSFRALVVPVKGDNIKFSCADSAVVSVPLWSRASGRERTRAEFTINVGKLTPGQKRILRKAALGEIKIGDSSIVFKDSRDTRRPRWFLHLTLRIPASECKLDPANVAVLRHCDGDASDPFAVTFGESKSWNLGMGRMLESESRRLESRRMNIRTKYRDAGSGRRGHGHGRLEYSLRPTARRIHGLAHRVQQKIVADVVRFCERFDCGTVKYLEPSVPARQWGWFGRREMRFDFSGLEARLANKLREKGIAYSTERPPKKGVA